MHDSSDGMKYGEIFGAGIGGLRLLAHRGM